MIMICTFIIFGILVYSSAVSAFADEWEYYIPIKCIEDVLFINGEIYCAAGSGLFILDDNDFTYRRVTKVEGFPDFAATTLVQENEKSILVATEIPGDNVQGTGIYRYTIDTGNWQKLECKDFSDHYWPYISDMERDISDAIWGAGMGYFVQMRGNEVVILDEDSELPENYQSVISLATDLNGNIVVTYNAKEGSGIARRIDDTWVTILELPGKAVGNLTVAPDGTIWFSQTDTVYAYDGKTLLSHATGRVGNYFSQGGIAATSDSIIWCAGKDTLVQISGNVITDMSPGFREALEPIIAPYSFRNYKGVYAHGDEPLVLAYCHTGNVEFEVLGKQVNGDWKFFVPEDNLIYPYHSASPSELAVDNEGTLWMSGFFTMFAESVVSFDGDTWLYHGSSMNYDIAFDGKNRIWLFGGGARYYENNVWTVFSMSDYPIFEDIMRAGCAMPSSAWMGDGHGNVYRYKFGGEWTKFPATDVGAGYVHSIVADDRLCVWVTGSNGAAYYEGDEWSLYTPDNSGLPGKSVNCVIYGKDGVVWFATSSGFASLDDGTWEVFTMQNSGLPDDRVRSVMTARNGDLWISTRGGLCRYDGESWEAFTKSNAPLPTGSIREAAESPDGSIWITDMGLLRYTPDIKTKVKQENGQNPAVIAVPTIYPNPFNPTTSIEFDLPETGMATLTIYNIAGQKVRELLSGYKSAGKHRIVWDGTDESGNAVSAGVYIARLKSGEITVTGKMVLIR